MGRHFTANLLLPPPSGASGAFWHSTGPPDSAQAPPPPPPSSSTHQGDQSTGTAAPTISSDNEVGRDHVPTVNLRQSWWKPLTEDRPATPEPALTIPSSDLSMPTNNWASALKSTYAPPQENSLLAQTGDMATFMDWRGFSSQFQMEECHKLLTDQVDDTILRYNVGRSSALSNLEDEKKGPAYYLDVGLEQLCLISSGLKRNASRTSCLFFSMYGYNYMKKIVLRRADLKEYVIAEVKGGDFKIMYPSDFEVLLLLNSASSLEPPITRKTKRLSNYAVNLWDQKETLVIIKRVATSNWELRVTRCS
ncbi:hypothetical protein Tco_0793325 [Tanacetum coccineum]